MFDAALYLKLFSALGFLLGGSMFLYKNKKNKMKNGWLPGILLILAGVMMSISVLAYFMI